VTDCEAGSAVAGGGAPQSNVERAHNTAALMVSYPNNRCASKNARTRMET
jgi:hypothetical protein